MSRWLRALVILSIVSVAASSRMGTPAGVPGAGPGARAGLAAGEVPPYAPSRPHGHLAGTFAADGNGAATYELPIVVPPGTAGVQPELALTYNSHRENGYVGMGWQLSGLSAIGRCGATYELDGYKAGVAFDERDRFCLDGNRLVALSGAYGADGTVYHTANETQTSVISHGTCGQGPCSFTAYNKNGDRLSFGGTADSRILAQGRADGSVRAWALDRHTDLNGNYSAVAYSSDPETGEYVPLRVEYTGNDGAGLAPQRRVEFGFESRTDAVRRYLGGSLVQITKRLRSITTSVSGSTAQTYTIDYETSSFTLRSRPRSITRCDAAGVCLPPIELGWQTEPGDFEPATSTLPGPLYVTVNGRVYPLGVLQDFDGDGIADYSVATEFLSGTMTRELAVWLGKPDGTFVASGFSLPGPVFRATSANVVMCGVLQDIDGDAILDYSPATYNAATGQTDLSVYLGTRGGFAKASFSLPDAVYWQVNNQTLQTGALADMNGDGIPDYSRATRLTSSNQLLLSIWKGTGSGFVDTGKSLPGPLFAVSSSLSARVGVLRDIDGDGIADYSPASVNAGTGAADLSVWTGRTPDFTFTRSFELPGQLIWIVNGQSIDSGLLVDLNGDGIPDYSRATELLATGERFLDVHLGTGRGFVDAGFEMPGPVYLISGERAEIAGVLTQINGDGTSRYSRATRFSGGVTELGVWLGSGEGFRPATFAMPEPLFEVVDQQVYAQGIYEDLNGDGMTDFANTSCTMTQPGVLTHCNLGVRLAKGPLSDLLAAVTTGFGGTTSIEYAPLSSPEIYSRGAAPAYPVREAQSSVYALSRYVSSDSRGASYAFSYAYAGARTHVLGRGWLGFTRVTMTEEAGGRQSETTYSMTSPYYGLITSTTLRDAAGTLLETTANTYEDFAPAAHQAKGVHQPLQTSFTDTRYQDGVPAFSSGRGYGWDAYGNMTFEEVRGDEATGVLPVYHCTRYLNEPDPRVHRLGFALQKKAVRTAAACQSFLALPNGEDVRWDPATDLRWSKIAYDASLNVVSESDWDDTHSLFTSLTYTVDPYGNTLTITNATGDTTTYTYDATYHTFLETVTSPPLRGADGAYALQTSQLSEPRFGVLVQSVDANGNVTRQDVDGFGRPVAVWGPSPDGDLVQLVSALWHDDGGAYLEIRTRPSWSSSPDPSTWYWQRLRFDGLARQYREEQNGLENGEPATIVRELFFDAQGRVHRQAESYYEGRPAPIVTTEYDALNRPLLITDPSGVREKLGYHDGGLRVTHTLAYDTPDATTSIQLHDVEGRVRERIAANGQSTTFGYDPLGQILTMASAPLSRPASVTYDSMGNVLSITRADSGTTTFSYDSSSRLRGVTDASGNTLDFDEYDALQRVLKRTARYGGQTSVWSFTYDETAYRNGRSNLTTAVIEAPVLGTATYHYGWDAYGEELAGSVTLAGTTYHHATLSDPLGRPSEEIYPDGAVVALRYGADENLATIAVTDPGANAARTWATLSSYTAAGQLQDLFLDENGVEVARRYHPDDVAFGKLRSIDVRSTRQGDRSLLSLIYAWNSLDQVTAITDNDDPAQSQGFGYRDQPLNAGMGFLTSAVGGYGSRSFRYEELGNVTQRDDATFTYAPGTDHLTGSSSGVTWQFAANGFLRSRTGATHRDEYTFDADGNLVAIARAPVGGAGEVETLLAAAYDHTGLKVLETTAGGSTVYNVTEGYEVTKLPDGGVQHTRYVGGPFGPLAAVTGAGSGVTGLGGAAQRSRARALLSGQATLAARAGEALYALLSMAPRIPRLAGMTSVALLALATLALIALATRRSTQYARGRPLHAHAAPIVAACVLIATALPAYGDLTPGDYGPGVPVPGRVLFVQDLVGSTVVVTSGDGSETARVAYEPYGLVDRSSSRGTDDFRPKFAGKPYDPATGLYDFTARRFDPLLGRFISPDPQSQYVSPYLYGGNDPVSMLDPDGELAFLAAIVVGAVLGAYFGAAAVNGQPNPLDWNWQSGTTWAGIFGGAAIGAVGAAAGGLVVHAGVAVGSLGGTSAQLAGVAIGIGGGALVGAGENAAFTALGGGTNREIARAAVTGAFFGAVFGGSGQAVSMARRGTRGAPRPGDSPFGDVGPGSRRATSASACSSFVAGTPVETADGSLRAIERVAPGDLLTGREPDSGNAGSGTVRELVRHEARDLVRVTLASDEWIDATPEHPFYLDRGGWVAARHLGAGDLLATSSGAAMPVASVERRREPSPVPVHNFVIPGTESYHVGQAGLLVHNGKPRFCTGSYSGGIYKETWSKSALKKKFPVKADYKMIKQQIRDKGRIANSLISTLNPRTSVANPVKTWSLPAARRMYKAVHGPKAKLPGAVRKTLQALQPKAPGLMDVDEAIPRIHGGLTGAQGYLHNQQPFNSTLNSASGGVAGAIATKYPNQPITQYVSEFVP